jgi:hypothetical protein
MNSISAASAVSSDRKYKWTTTLEPRQRHGNDILVGDMHNHARCCAQESLIKLNRAMGRVLGSATSRP